MGEYTKEPWQVSPNGFDILAEVDSVEGGYVVAMSNRKRTDARRIVACVNACTGYKTDELEQIGRWITSGESAEVARLNEQRDELLAALIDARKEFVARGWVMPGTRACEALKRMDIAIGFCEIDRAMS